MEKEETGQRQSGIFNYFEGATINNLVINNGTYNKSGVDHHYYSSKDNREKHSYSDEQIAQAIENINGEGKPIDSKQKWAAVYWYLRWQCKAAARLFSDAQRTPGSRRSSQRDEAL